MTILAIQNHVNSVLTNPKSCDAFDARLDELSTLATEELSYKSRKCMRELAKNYIESSVWLLAEVDQLTTTMGMTDSAGPILQIAAGYFLLPDDMIPDQSGLFGLLDDAYLTVRFMTRLSEHYQFQTGAVLFYVELDQSSDTIRQLIGEQLAATLDQMVENGLSQALQQTSIEQLVPYRYRSTAHWNQWMGHQNQVAVEAEISSIAGGWF